MYMYKYSELRSPLGGAAPQTTRPILRTPCWGGAAPQTARENQHQILAKGQLRQLRTRLPNKLLQS